MSAALLAIATISFAAWLYLLFGRGFFWLPRFLPKAPPPARWPSVVAIVPARDEAEHVGTAIASLLAQDYAGAFSIVLVDDHSSDGTADIARAAARAAGKSDQLTVIAARPLPLGWTGKLWALAEGVRSLEVQPDLYLFTDADISHHPQNITECAESLEHERRDLVSLMVRLRCRSFAERLLVPAFVFFFAMLYPFAWASDDKHRTAAAAGGCMLVRRSAYERIGGYAAIREALIDDCALAREVKRGGSISLALSDETRSLRAYPKIADVWAMIARTAYTQLNHSPLLLVATVLSMTITFIAPPLLVLAGGDMAWLGTGAWVAMALAYSPMLRVYRRSPGWAPLLPLVSLVYLGATVASALLYHRGRGGAWKGRVQWQSQR